MADVRSKAERVFTNYFCYKIDPLWRRLPASERQIGGRGLSRRHPRGLGRMAVRSYLTTGFREDIDFFLSVISKDAEPIQELAVNIYQTGFGKYLHMTTSYFALMRESPYVKDHLHAPMPEVGDCKYLVVYPFIKSRECI